VTDAEDIAWQKLDKRTLGVTTAGMLGVCVAIGVPVTSGLINNDALPVPLVLLLVLSGVVVVVGAVVLYDYLRIRKTWFRVTDEKVELRTGILRRQHRAVHRERIRTVDVHAHPLYRVFGVAKVHIGTGEHAESEGSQLTLDAVSRSFADMLRDDLLTRPAPTVDSDEPVGEPPPVLAEFDLGWLRYVPVSIWPGVLGVAACGVAWQITDWFGLRDSVLGQAAELIRELSLWTVIPLAVVVVLVVGLVASLAFGVEAWWNFRLQRTGDTLQVRRGLLIHRSLSLAEDRLRGVELVEPYGARLLGGGRLEAVATGIRDNKPDQPGEDTKVLLPEAPREIAQRVAAEILREPESPTTADITGHPRAALRRRLVWAVAAVAVVEAVLVVIGLTVTSILLHVAWISALVLLPGALFVAIENYRNLGHGHTADYLLVRYGVLARRTAALRRSGIIGVTVRQSPFQRRLGLADLTATTGAGSGAFTAYDADAAEALGVAGRVVPELLDPFVVRD